MNPAKLAVSVCALVAASTTVASARDNIRIVGSSTVFPYTQAVAEEFGNQGGAAPVVESTGTGGGFQVFCAGIGEGHPDVTGASRSMRKSEFDLCVGNGVTSISEALIGHDGLSIAVSRGNSFAWSLSLAEIYLALAAQVPVDGKWVDNPYRRWPEINPALPNTAILVYGPPPTSGTRDAFVELAMHIGCRELPFVKDGGFNSGWVNDNCSRMRQDGPFVEAGENDNLIVQRLDSDPNALGIFGYSFLYENLDRLKGVAIDGVDPSPETIADFSYPIARPLYFYVKNAHRGVIRGLDEFLVEYMSDTALAEGGYLQERGLVVLPLDRMKAVQESMLSAQPMAAPER